MENTSQVEGSTATTMPYKRGSYSTENKSVNATQDALASYPLASNTQYHKSCLLNDYKEYDFINNIISITVFSQNCYLHFSHKRSQFPS